MNKSQTIKLILFFMMLTGMISTFYISYNFNVTIENEIKLLNETIENQSLENIKLNNLIIESKNNNLELLKKLNKEKDSKDYYIKELLYYQTLDSNLAMTPRWKDVKSFLHKDKTNLNTWTERNYDCTAFSTDVVKNAIENNIFMCIVEVNFIEGAHIIIAVNTSNKGLLYIEPQSDNIVNLQLGKKGLSNFPKQTVISYESCFERIL